MKVCFIGLRSLAASGGIETMVKQVASRVARFGFDITVYCRTRYNPPDKINGTKELRLANVPTIYSKHLESLVYSFLASFLALFRGEHIMHYQALGPSLFSFLPRLFGRRTVVTVHALDWKRKKWGFFAHNLLKMTELCAIYFPNRTVVVSKTLQRYFKAKYNRDVIYIPNAIEEVADLPLEKLTDFGIEKGRYILFLSRIMPEKGLHLLLEAFRQIKTDMRLLIVGDAYHGHKYFNKMKTIAKQDPRVVFAGPLYGKEKEQALSNAYLFVLPSYVEGMSIVLLEAMAHGICPLVSDIEENMEVIESAKSENPAGFSFRCDDVVSLKERLEFLIKSPDVVAAAGSHARRKVYRDYDWNAIAAQYAAIYREISRP